MSTKAVQKFMSEDKDANASCPYCKVTLAKRPARKTRCPSCNNDIYVRTSQKIFSSTLLTWDDAIAVDWLKKIELYGVTGEQFVIKRQELSMKFGTRAKSTDAIWGLFNDLLIKRLADKKC